MAIKKATTVADLTEAAPVVAEGYTVIVGPSGVASTVPDGIVEALLDSGYKRK